MARQISRRQFIRFTAMSAGATLLAACAPSVPAGVPAGEATAASTAAASGSTSAGGGTLVIGYPQKTTYGNFCQPWFYAGTQDLYQRRLTYSGLVQWNNDFSDFLPDLAESWEFDGNQAIFHLRQDVNWHDGEPFTAEDVIYSFQIIGHPDSLWTYPEVLQTMIVGFQEYRDGAVEEISGINMVDEYTVTFDLTDAYRRPFLNTIASYVINPKHLLDEQPLDQLLPEEGLCKTEWALETGIGTGPFKVVQYVPDQYIEFEAYENYHRGEIQLDKIIYNAYTDGQAQAAALESGECHLGTIPPSEYPRFQEMDHVDIKLNPGLANTAFFLNTNTIEQPIRQAMWWAIDRQAIVDSFYHGATTVPGAIFEYGGYGVGSDVQQYAYDPDRARELLAEANWDSSRVLRFMVESIDPAAEPLYSLVLGYWAEVGINVEYQVVGADYGNVQLEPEGTDILFSGQVWGADPGEGVRYYLNAPDKLPFIVTPEAEAILETINVSEDEEEIKQGIYRLQELGSELVTVIPIARTPGIWVINKRVKGDINPVYALWTRNDWQWENVTVDAA